MTLCVDAHAHLYAGSDVASVEAGFADVGATEVALSADMRAADVDGAVLVQPSAYGRNHDLLVGSLGSGRYAGVGLVDATAIEPGEVYPEIRRLQALGLVGVRIHLVASVLAVARAAAEAAGRLGVVLDIHVQEAAWDCLWEIADATDGGAVVIDHLGRPDDPSGPGVSAFLRALARRENIALKVSGFEVISRTGFPYRDMARVCAEALDRVGADRLMWASNFPYCRGASYTALLNAFEELLELNEPDHAAVMGGTATRVFSVPGVIG